MLGTVVIGTISVVLVTVLCGLIAVDVVVGLPRWSSLAYAGLFSAMAIVEFHIESWGFAVLDLVVAALHLWWYWHHRPRSRKLSKLLGYKMRAVRDKIISSMPKSTPSPLPAAA